MTKNRLIDVRTITDEGPAIHFVATDSEKKEIARRFDIPTLLELQVNGAFTRDDLIFFTGKMRARADRVCSVTLNSFAEKTDVPVHIAFSEIETDTDNPEDVDIFPITKGKIDLFDTFSEVFGLNLNPFPKSVSQYLDYTDPGDSERVSPFAVLKKIKKKG